MRYVTVMKTDLDIDWETEWFYIDESEIMES